MRLHWIAAALWLAVGGVGWSADDPKTHEQVSQQVRQLLQDRKFADAVTALDAVLATNPMAKDRLLYLKGRALYLHEQYAPAVQVFEQLEKELPQSPWVQRARFHRALALVRLGDFRPAELIYRDEVTGLLSEDRKHALAAVYLEFADTHFQPPKEDQKRDFAKALEFYQKALEVGPKPAKRIEVELRVAECLEELQKFDEAAKKYDAFAKEHPTSELAIEARYRLGDCQLKLNQPVQARRTWQDLLADHPDAKSKRIAEAAFHLCRTYGIPRPRSDEDLNLGVNALERFVQKRPDHELAGQAHLWMAQSRIHRGRFEPAAAGLKSLLGDARYAERPEVADARNLLGRCYQLQKKFPEALAAWREYLAKHSAHSAWSEVQSRIIETEYLIGYEARRQKQFGQARRLWTEFLAKHPLDNRARAIMLDYGRMNFEQEKFEAAIEDWRRLVTKYPKTEESSHAQFLIAVTLEEKLGRLEEALKEYRKVTWGSQVWPAQQRIARLTARHLLVATERVFRSDETPKLKLVTRNIDTVTVRVYTVDLETYFRKMHRVGEVESLDIALINPDQSFEFAVPKYEEHRELESAIPVELKGSSAAAGVLAVTVSSKTLEATTLVIKSDLDVVVKASRDEVFVFAENLRTGEPWPKVRLLVSNGKEIFGEAVSGKDGVFQKSFKELKDAEDLRVFAVADGHVASNLVSLKGVGVAKGLAAKGYIYTDRPAYRPGQLVHIRGIIREVAADAFVISKDKKFTIEVFDPRSRLIHSTQVALNEHGSFHTHLAMPAAAVQGDYRIQVRDQGSASFQGGFAVHEYQLEPVQLSVKTDRKVYYRGEPIKGTITAAFYYGAPLVGKEIRYQLADEPVKTAVTDAKGEVAFEFPTRDFRETQTLPLVVMLPERNLQFVEPFLLATQGFSIALKTVRPVYLAGETFETTITTTDAEGKPIAQELVLSVLERTVVDGQVGERLAETHKVQTRKEDGVGRATIKLERGAEYVLRAEGIDRFQNPVSGTHGVRISDDEDETRLRILADRHTYKAGDTATVNVHWREEPALALVTYQGARILGYQLVRLQKGANQLAVPMESRLAPNFDLSVVVMTDPRRAGATGPSKKAPKRFHEAASPFSVERNLQITLTAKRRGDAKGPIRPGEEIEVLVTALDPQGKPVVAEVSLGMVEAALLARFPAKLEPIEAFFQGGRRESAVRSGSSITFAYHPTTKPINPRLLAEADRLLVEEEEARRAVAVGESLGAGAGGLGGGGPAAGARRAPAPAPPMSEPAEEAADHEVAAVTEGQLGQQLAALQSSRNARERLLGRADQPRRGADADAKSGFAERSKEQAGKPVMDAYGAGGRIARRYYDDSAAQAPATAFQLYDFFEAGQNEVAVQLADGAYKTINLAFAPGEADAKLKALSAELSAAGAVLLPALAPGATGYWNPAVLTAADGKATLVVTVPQRSTAWKLSAKGITTTTLAGEATTDLAVKKDLFGELKLPLAFTDGDKADVPVVVHNDLVEKGRITVTLRADVGDKKFVESKTIEAAAKGMHELAFSVELRRPAEQKSGPDVDVHFELTVAAGEQKDVSRRIVPLRPFGMPVFATASGTAASDATTWIALPEGMPVESPTLEVMIGPTVQRSLLDIVLGQAPWCQLEAQRTALGLDRATSDLMASLALARLVGTTRDARSPHLDALDNRARSAVGLLVAAQNDDGSWSWTGKGGAGDRYTSARIVWALSLARSAGYPVPQEQFAKAVGYLQSQAAATPESDYETKAVLLHALAVAGQGDFAVANRLYRNRPSLSSAALAYLALALVEIDRKPMAAELLVSLAKRNLDAPMTRGDARHALVPWNAASAELRALVALGLQKAAVEPAKTKELVDWLLAHRVGHRWTPEKATGPATLALCGWFAKARFQGEHYKLTVYVNDKPVTTIEVGEAAETQTMTVPPELLKKGKQRVNFTITGRGEYTYQCVLGGFVPAGRLKSAHRDWVVYRYYQPAPLEVDGKEVPRGFDVLQGGYSAFRNKLTQLPVGRRGHIELYIGRHNLPPETNNEQLEYLVITEPLPSGATVIEQSVRGAFERFELAPGAITFYVGNRRYVGTIEYDVHGYVPGEYQAAPTVLRDAYRPERFSVGTVAGLAVLPLGATSGDPYRLTPRELFELGKIYFAKKDYKRAASYLVELINKWNTNAEVYKESARMLLDGYLETGPAHEIVRYFEIIKERWPDLEVPFGKIMKVAAAYHDIGEYERSYLVYRATAQSSFQRESELPGFLGAQKEFLRSVTVMQQLLLSYPPEAYIAEAAEALAEQVYAKAATANDDPKLREQKVFRVDLIRRAALMLDDFLTEYPADPAADQASFALANALLELKDYKGAISACARYAERFPESELVDSFWYVIGYGHFALGQHEQALEMCKRVAEAKRLDKQSGREAESRNKWRAVYIRGQVYHSLGRALEAIREYQRVADKYADAREAIDYFRRKAIELPEVSTIQPNQPAEVELEFRNIARCDVKVYKIDLMTFTLLERNLQGVTRINLAGIRPHHEALIELGTGEDFHDRSHKLALPLKEEGAYLVVARGADLHASGLVLVSPLAVEIQEDAGAGRVRATIRDAVKEGYVPAVHVKVIGTRNDDFVSGDSDLRGVFVADGIKGAATVVAQASGNRYAFYRGRSDLGPPPEPAKRELGKAQVQQKVDPSRQRVELLEDLMQQNRAIQQDRQGRLQRLYEKKAKGVEVKGAFDQ